MALSLGLGVVVAGYGLAGSYVAVSELAARHSVPQTWLVAAGVDGGLVAVVVLDLVLTWIGAPVGVVATTGPGPVDGHGCGERDRNHLQDLTQWAAERLHEPLTVCDLADRANMSTRNLGRHFNRSVGVAPDT